MAESNPGAQARIARLEQELTEAQQEIGALQKQVMQRKMEARPDLANNLFRALFEQASDAILIADDEGRYIDANRAAAELFGVPRQELRGKTAENFGPPELDFGDTWQSFLESEAEQGQFLLHRPDGEVRYTEYSAVSGFLPGYHLSILRDITARKQIEREKEKALYDLSERVKEATLMQRAGQILSERDKSLGEALEAIVALIPSAWQFSEIAVAQMSVGAVSVSTPNFARTPWCQQVTFRTEQGVVGTVEVAYLEERAQADEGPFLAEERATLTALAQMLQTALERRGAIQALRRSETKYRTLYETMTQGVVYSDAQGRIVGSNPAATAIFGRALEESFSRERDGLPPIIDEAGNRLAPEELPARVALRTARPVHDMALGVYVQDKADYQWVLANAIPQFRAGRADPYQVCTTFEDITERKKRETERNGLVQELKALAATLEEQVQLRTAALKKRTEQLKAVASALTVAEQRERKRISQILHDDLQQLLYAAQLRVLMLESDLTDGAPAYVQEAVADLDRLQDQALSIARSLTVTMSPPVLKGEGLAEAFGWLAGHMKGVHGLQVEISIEEIEMDSSDLRELAFQMVRELLDNVVKHAKVKRAQLIVRQKGERCEITVADEGPGIDPAVLERPDELAAGYGLQAIRERLALFDGSLVVRSAAQGGSQVTLTLPCRAASPQAGTVRGTA